MAAQIQRDPHMAEQHDHCVLLRLTGKVRPIDASLTHIAIMCKQPVKPCADPCVFLLHRAASHHRRIRKSVSVVHPLFLCPETGIKIPGDHALSPHRVVNERSEFPQPGKGLRLSSHLFQAQGSGVLRPSQGRHIKVRHLPAGHAFRQKRSLPPAFFRQAVFFIIRVSMPDENNSHNNPHFCVSTKLCIQTPRFTITNPTTHLMMSTA